MKHRIIATLLCLLLALPLAAVAAAPVTQEAERLAADILTFKATQSGCSNAADWAASALPDAMGAGGEWYAIALHQCGGYDLSPCRAALLEYLKEHTVRSATTRQKYALTLLAAGGQDAFVEATLADAMGKQGVMSWAWGLHLLSNGCAGGEYAAQDVVEKLLSLRKADGGWAITGNFADVDATAMALQALAPYRRDAEVAAAVEAAVTLLSARQLENGGFASYGVENAESAAQVVIALCALEIDPFADPRFVKEGVSLLDVLRAFRLPDGSYAHTRGGAYHESATAQTFLALTAYQRYQAGKASLYLLDVQQPAGQPGTKLGYKPIAAMCIGAAAMAVCVVLLATGKRHPKNFLAVALSAALLIAGVYVTEFQSAEEYYSAPAVKKDAVGQVTLSIRCDKVAGRAGHIPADGVILPETWLPIAAGDTVYTILTDAARAHNIHLESSGANGLMYVNGVGNVYELEYGDLSGWVFMVNGESSAVGCDQYALRDGDRIEWHYTLELGKDVY